jgi:hypothetical protein
MSELKAVEAGWLMVSMVANHEEKSHDLSQRPLVCPGRPAPVSAPEYTVNVELRPS